MTDDILLGYIRVSTVLDFFQEPGLVDWKVRKGAEANKLSKQAKKIGTEIDTAVKLYVSTGSYGKVKSDEAKSCLEAFKQWMEDYKPRLTVGSRLYDEAYLITGEPDLYWGDVVIDIKAASAVRPKYHLQTAIYALMADKPKTAILRLHKQLGDYEFVERNKEEVEGDRLAFLGLLTAYKHICLLDRRGEQHVDSPATSSF